MGSRFRNVINYEKDSDPPFLYMTKSCQENEDAPGEYDQDCQIDQRLYKVENDFPVTQEFSFASTIDNDIVFIPERIMESKKGRKTFILDPADDQSCFTVDPVDKFSEHISCTAVDDSGVRIVDKEEEFPMSLNVVVLLMFFIMLVLGIAFVFGLLMYFR